VTLLVRNLIANFAGSLWTAVMSLAVLPACLRLMGVEAYGLVGIFATLVAMLVPFEAGLGTALNRHLAGAITRTDGETNAQIVRTLEIVNWTIGGVCGILVALLAPLIAHHWVKPAALSPDTVQTVILIMGLVIAVQWPQSLYSGGLSGLQQQVSLNIINAAMGTLRSVGSVLVLMFVSRTVVAYFVWQIVVSAIQTGTTAVVLWRHIGERPQRPYFRRHIVVGLRRFLFGMSGMSAVLLLVTQLDKAVLSRMLPLAMFGYYNLAGSVASNLLRLVVPVHQAFFPQMAGALTREDGVRQAALYHRMAQIIIVLTAPLALLVVAFSREALYVWTGDPVTAARTAPILMLLMFGTLVNSLMYPSYTAQIAAGWTRLLFTSSVCSALVLAPALVILAARYGAVGAATVWPVLNVGLIAAVIPLMHRRLLHAEAARWLRADVIIPASAALAVVGGARLLLPEGLGRPALFAYLAIAGCVAFAVTVLVTPTSRALVLGIKDGLLRRIDEAV
jgi:O-antigen/teichoic acid export membrane protein